MTSTTQRGSRLYGLELHTLGLNEIQTVPDLVKHTGRSMSVDLVLQPKSIRSSDYQREMHSMPGKVRKGGLCNLRGAAVASQLNSQLKRCKLEFRLLRHKQKRAIAVASHRCSYTPCKMHAHGKETQCQRWRAAKEHQTTDYGEKMECLTGLDSSASLIHTGAIILP